MAEDLNNKIYKFIQNNLSKTSDFFQMYIEKVDQNLVLSKEGIAKLLGIADIDKNHSFLEAMNGDGQSSFIKFSSLNSSSLLPFLFFANISNQNKFFIKFKNEILMFSEAHFEFKNKVFARPSNIDVVLLGENRDGKKVILFIESKFTEYHRDAETSFRVSPKYVDLMKACVKSNACFCSQNVTFLRNDGGKDYFYGIKQMIAHNIGIQHFMNRHFFENNLNSNKVCETYYDAQAYFCELLFFDKRISEDVYFCRFKNHYQNTIEILKKENKKVGLDLHFFDNVITYQEIVKENPNYKINQVIKNMYNL